MIFLSFRTEQHRPLSTSHHPLFLPSSPPWSFPISSIDRQPVVDPVYSVSIVTTTPNSTPHSLHSTLSTLSIITCHHYSMSVTVLLFFVFFCFSPNISPNMCVFVGLLVIKSMDNAVPIASSSTIYIIYMNLFHIQNAGAFFLFVWFWFFYFVFLSWLGNSKQLYIRIGLNQFNFLQQHSISLSLSLSRRILKLL